MPAFAVLHLHAQAASSDFNLTTSPLPVLLTTKPGGSVSTTLRVQNSGTSPVHLNVSLKKFKADGTTGKPILLDKQPGDDYFDWVHFSATSFEADPGVWSAVGMTINTPADAAYGYYYAVVFSNANPTPAPSNTGSALNGGTAILTLLNVQAPGEKRQLGLYSFTAGKKLYEYLPVNFAVKVSNTGNILVSPSGSIFISRGSKTVATLDVNPASGNILPDSSRTFLASWNDGFPVFKQKTAGGQVVSDSHGQPIYQLSWDFSKVNHLRFGHYKAELLLTYNDGTKDVPLTGQVSFWVVPWKILPLIILLVILIGIGLWTSGRAIWKRFNKKSHKKGD